MPDWLQEILAGPTTSVPLASKALGISRNGGYEAVQRGEMPAVRFGSRLIVPTNWLRKVLQVESVETPQHAHGGAEEQEQKARASATTKPKRKRVAAQQHTAT